MPRINYSDKSALFTANLQTQGTGVSSPPWSGYSTTSLTDGDDATSFWFASGSTLVFMGVEFGWPALVTKVNPWNSQSSGDDFITYVEYRDVKDGLWKRAEYNNADTTRNTLANLDSWIVCSGIRYYFKDDGTGNSIGSGSGWVRFNEFKVTGYKINNLASAFTENLEPTGIYNEAAVVTQIAQLLLVQSGDVIKTFASGSWQDVGLAPVTEDMFKTKGMSDLSTITEAKWREIPSDSKILAYTETDKVFTADIYEHNLYDSSDKSYHGTGIMVTEMEELPLHRKFLMINADHEGCTFRYSLNNGVNWHIATIGGVEDISAKVGTQLVIEISLPLDSAKLTAISYAWA